MIFSRDHVRKGDQEYQKGNLQRAAELYLKAKRFRQAAGVYAELGRIGKAVEIYVKAGHPRMAAELLAAEGRDKEAIQKYEEAGDFAAAAKICLKANYPVRAGRLFERAKMYRRAAEAFTAGGEIEGALRALEAESAALRGQRTSGRSHALEKQIRELDARRAEILSNLGRHLEAAELLAEHGRSAPAAAFYERAGRFGRAAQSYLDAGRITEALAAIEKAPNAEDELKAEIYLNCGRHREAAEIFEHMGRYDAAASAYEGAESWARAAELWEKAEAYGRAADFFKLVERYQDAGRCFAMADRHDEAAEAFALAGNDLSAADAYLASDNQLKAGQHYLKAGQRKAGREALQAVSVAHPGYGEASLELIPLMVEDGLLAAAVQRLELLHGGDLDLPSYALRYCEGRIEEARGRLSAAESCYQRALAERHDFRDVEARLRDLRGKVPAGAEPLEPSEVEPGRAAPRKAAPRKAAPRKAASREAAPRESAARESAPREAAARESEPLEAAPTVATVRRPAAPAASPTGTASRPSAPVPSAPVPSAPVPPAPPELSTADAAELPFDLEQRIDPWWSGAEFFRATDRRTRQPILLVSFPLAEVASRVEGFRQAMRQVAALDHPTILKLHETIMASDKVLLVYEPFGGETLASLLAARRLPALTSLNVVVQLAEALSTAHKLGVTHQWLSPRTVLIDDGEERLKLVGMGLRDVLADRDATSRAYLSPEVLDGGVVGPASDVYSLGLLAMELLQAQLPAGWADRDEVDPKTVGWPDEVEETVPRSARDALVRALGRALLGRPSTVELASALSSVGLVSGQILANRYEILGELGRGGMSRVYRARDRDLDEEVAIKTVLTPAVGRSEDEDRLWQEVKICRKISHPNVVRVHDFGRFPGGIFVTMELLDGPGLDVVIEEQAPLEIARVRDLLKGIAGALAEAHRLSIIHRDLKPSNVILVGDRVKVLDFGIARMSDGSATSNLTRTGQVVGSPMYMAPEQIQGQPLAGTSDLYALGVIAYTLLTGREPFLADTTTAVVMKHLHEPPPDVLELRPDLAGPWVDLLGRLLAKKPADRFQSAREVLEALRALPV